jgi:DNA polymerase-3 subunit beta
MKFTIERDVFLRAAAQCARVVNKKSAMPVLTGVHLTARAGELEFYATDQITTVRTRVAATVERPGAACLPAHALVDTVQAMVPGQVLAQVDEKHRAVFKSGRRKTEVAGMSADDYPALVAAPTDWLELRGAVFHALLATVVHAMSHDAARPHLCVVYLCLADRQLDAVTTDGHRLARATTTTETTRALEVCVPAPAVEALLRDPPAETVGLCVQPPNVWIRTGETCLASKLIEQGQFPAYKMVIPTSHDRRVQLARGALLETVHALRKASAGEGLVMAFERAVVDLRMENYDRGQADAQLDAQLEGTPLVIAVKAEYLAELLGALDTATVDLAMGGKLDPMHFRVESTRGVAAEAVIMPMNF